uniref:DUF4347 domain-containing protein n=1 Tax=Aquabacterium sp. TaxID=1872578 RepID=UPI0027B9CE8A
MNKPTRHFLSDSQLVQVRPMALEQRFMFDAAAVSTVTDLPHTTEATHTDAPASDGGVDGLARFAEAAAVGIQEVDSAADPSVSGVRLEVVFVDGSIRNYQQLVADVKPGTEVVVLGGTKDGLQQIADYLDGRSGIDAIHLLSHGSEGTFELGNTWLNSQNIGQHAEQLNAIGAALASDGDILIYGCNTGEGTQGETLLSELARLTQADIAASENSTGAANKGGDWLLERQLGEIATASLSVEGYQSLLAAPVDQNFDDPVLWRPLNNNSETIGGVTYTMVTPTLGSNAVAAIFSDDNWFSITPTGADQAVVFNYDGNTTIAGPIDVRIASADGAEFRLVSMEIDTGAGLGTNPNLTVKGYLNGVVVASDTINTGVSESTGSVTYTKNGIAVGFGGTLTFNSAWQYINEIRITGTDTVIAIDDLNFEAAVPPNVAPVVSNLNGDSVTWAGVGNTVSLDAGGNANLADTELNALNSGNGNWAGASLIIQRPGTAVSGDTFGFNTSGALFTVSGGNLQSGGQTFATFANTGGVLTISFTSSATAATTALVNDIAQRITYRSDTPAGDATLRFTLSDGMASSTADVTVTSNTIHVTATGDAQSDGIANGVTLREAITIANAQAGADTIILPASLAGQTVTLGSALTISEAVTIDADAAPGVIIAGTGITA